KIGHAGTLDPIASGLLIVLIGRATKSQSEVMGSDKIYRCRLRFGLRTDTADITGQIIEEFKSPPPSADKLNEILSQLTQERLQVPPMYSAIKRDGVPLYKLARKGETVERKPRPISIRWIEPLGTEGDEASFRVSCSSGTYLRSLVERIGERAGTGATMTGLVRESVGRFRLENAVSGEVLKTWDLERILQSFVPVHHPN
ncbi:MAG: tRNA pseudouridine(55) synthase TruB, partial [Elusimicrobia bacterium]|nr:tRNA pseudouridine(55) synthase TruB [Elusimicrobiota bacterium]